MDKKENAEELFNILDSLAESVSDDYESAMSYLKETDSLDELDKLDQMTKQLAVSDKIAFSKQANQLYKKLYQKVASSYRKATNAVDSFFEELSTSSLETSFRKLDDLDEFDAREILIESKIINEVKGQANFKSTELAELRKPQQAANWIIDTFNIREAEDIDLEGIAHSIGLFIDEKEIHGSEGRLVSKDDVGIVSIDATIREDGKKRFVLAHEMGHFLLHRGSQPYFICDNRDFNDWHRKNPQETEANEFAAELLMPKTIFRQQLSDDFDLDEIKRLSGIFGTSLTATARRYMNIGSEPIFIALFTDNETVWSDKSNQFPYQYFPLENPPKRTLTSKAFKGKEIGPDKEVTLAKSWFPQLTYHPQQYLYEQCVPMPNYNSVLTILWACNDY